MGETLEVGWTLRSWVERSWVDYFVELGALGCPGRGHLDSFCGAWRPGAPPAGFPGRLIIRILMMEPFRGVPGPPPGAHRDLFCGAGVNLGAFCEAWVAAFVELGALGCPRWGSQDATTWFHHKDPCDGTISWRPGTTTGGSPRLFFGAGWVHVRQALGSRAASSLANRISILSIHVG